MPLNLAITDKDARRVELPWADPGDVFAGFAGRTGSALLESQPGSGGRLSVICVRPHSVLEGRNGAATLTSGSGKKSYDSILQGLRYALREVPPGTTAVGYLGYEVHDHLRDDPIPAPPPSEPPLPDCWIGFYESALVFDHVERRLTRHGSTDPFGLTDSPGPFLRRGWSSGRPASGFTRSEYREAVSRVKAYITAGDTYQVNLSQRYAIPTDAPPWQTYLALRERNPAPYAAYLNLGGAQIVSSSPECFLTLDANTRRVETRPIKGTRPRGTTSGLDRRLADELLASDKDRAENVMIVDLERNDLGRICEFGTVAVPNLFALESHPTVHHLVSTITGRLREDRDRVDLLEACFPGGSITGAPKIRAMEIIAELEPVRRYVYCGAIGCMDCDGSMNLSIAIRTAVFKDGVCYLHVGGGIVADSDPDMEYEETLDKGRAFFEVLGCPQ
ncbi:MAG: aminodeoxychorismate synthase component I [Armatimonadetes bacterium]|nr:aminodeoxychorismate synthase component I [Armatimonadota bacterium]